MTIHEFQLSSSVEVTETEQPMGTSIDLVNQSVSDGRNDPGLASTITTIREITSPEVTTEQHYMNATAQLQMTPSSAVIDSVVSEYNDYYEGIIQEMLVEESSTSMTPDETGDLAAGVREILTEKRELLSGPDKLEVAQALALTGKADKVATLRNFYDRKVQELTADLSLPDLGWNILKTLAPGDFFVDASQLTGGSVLNVVDDLKSMFAGWRSLPAAEQAAMFPVLLDDIKRVTDGNPVAAQRLAEVMIDPTKDINLVGEALFDVMDIMGAVSLAATGANVIKSMARTGAVPAAAATNVKLLADSSEQVAESIKVSRVVGAANTSPFKFESHGLAAATDDLAESISKVEASIARTRGEVQEDLTEIMSRKESLTESALTLEEQTLAQERGLVTVNQLKQSITEQEGFHMTEAEIVGRTDTDFTVGFKLQGQDVTHTFDYTMYDKTGKYVVNEEGKTSFNVFERWFLSPLTSIEKLSPGIVGKATRVNFAQDSMLIKMQDAATKIYKGLGSAKTPSGIKARGKVNDVLMAGDEALLGEGKVYTLAELDAGIATPKGLVFLKPDEQAAYFASRDYYDALHFMESQRLSESLRFQGFKTVVMKNGGDKEGFAKVAGRPLDKSSVPSDIFRDRDAVVWSSSIKQGDGGLVKAKNLDIESLYTDGFTVVRLLDKQKINNEFVEFAIVKNTDVSNIGLHMINKKTGYIPKESKDGFYFVKQSTSAKVNGKVRRNGVTNTVGRFATKAEADKFKDGLVSGEFRSPRGTETTKSAEYTVLHDRELTPAQREREAVNGMGGLFSSSRARHDIVNSLTGETPRRINALEAMERQMGHVSRNMPLNQFRMGIQQEWLNTYKGILTDPTDFNSALTLDSTTKEFRAAEGSRTWIRDQMRIPTDAERSWEAMTRNVAEWMEGKPVLDSNLIGRETSLRRGVQALGHKDPFSLMRSATFHPLIGSFNPAQLWMQAQGISMAAAIDPVRAPMHIAKYLALRSGIFQKGSATGRTYGWLEKASGMEKGELSTIINEINSNGLFKAIKSTADYAASQQSYGFGSAAVRDIADKALVFFREGEMVNRGFGYITARGNWKRKNPGRDITTQESQKEILDDTLDLVLNLNRSARAAWQKGPVGNTTQFWQVNAKFMEAILPKVMGGQSKFTGSQKSRLLLGQLALYGAAGVPLGKWITEEATHAFGVEPEDMTPEASAAVTDGFWGYVANELTGDTLNLGSRGAMLGSITELIDKVLINRMPIEAVKTLQGASSSIPPRVKRVFDVTLPLMLSPLETEWTFDEFKRVASSIGKITSTWNNATKAMAWWDAGQARDAKGRLMFDIDKDNDMAMIFGAAMGFNPAKMSNIYDVRNSNFSADQVKSDKVKALTATYLDYFNTNMTEEDKKNLALRQKFIVGSINNDAIRELEKASVEVIKAQDTEETKQIIKAMQRHLDTGSTTTGLDGILFNPEVGKALRGEEN